MGVKGLWTLFGPYCEKKPLYEIRGQRVAVDLSGWVCDSQNVTDNHQQPRLYLRNLFFRTSYLLMENITPVFVLEGEAPALKADTMANRNQLQYKNHPKEKKGKKPDGKRKRFGHVLATCEKLLKSLGLECIQGVGEAEAMCAHLNSTRAVDAIISQDSDSFVYGGICVYRNFSVSNSGTNSTNIGSVDVYDLNKIKGILDFGREKMVALALLCGSDYTSNGIDGVGYASAIQFLAQHSNENILDRLSSWIKEPIKYENMKSELDNPTLCSSCGHHGNVRTHNRHGCIFCKMKTGCDDSVYKQKKQVMKVELSIRNKVIDAKEPFPRSDIIDEYLVDKENTPKNFRPRWKMPDLIKFVKLMNQYLGWTESYCVEKFLPLLTRWQLLNRSGKGKENISLLVNNENEKSWITPVEIKKKRNPKGIPCFEVIWKDTNNYYDGLIPDDQLIENDANLWTTIERQDLMEAAYPDIVDIFLESKNKLKRKKGRKNKKQINQTISKFIKKMTAIECENSEFAEINTSLKMLSITEKNSMTANLKRKVTNNDISYKIKPKRKAYKKKNHKDAVNISQKRMDVFLKKKLDRSNVTLNKTEIKSMELKNDNDSFDDGDLSNIIETMVKRNHLNNLSLHLSNKNFSSPKSSPGKTSDQSNDFCSTPYEKTKKRISYFFNDLQEGDDLFEKSLDVKTTLKSGSNTPYWSPVRNSSRKSSLCYTPLMERIRKLKQL